MQIPVVKSWTVTSLLPAIFLLLSAAFTGVAAKKSEPDFVIVRTLPDGEIDRRIHFRGVTVKELTALISRTKKQQQPQENVAKVADKGIRFVQVTDGRHFVQAIYDADFSLKDCEYVRDKQIVDDFLGGLKAEFAQARKAGKNADKKSSSGEGALTLLTGEQVKGEIGRLVDYKWIRNECKVLHKKIKEMAKYSAKKVDNEEETSISRKKRELFIYPGTNWCGMGSNSEGFNDLGLNAAADRCCRQHDHCPYTIEGFATKYNLFNYRFHTLSHCECDERFRTCLKMVDNGPSNLVGKLFFNVVQMKCFQLKSEKACTKRSWWGRCLKHEKKLTAHIKDVLAY